MKMIILMTMIMSQSIQLHHQQYDLQDNDQLAFHLQRLQVVPQFGLTAFEDQEDFNRLLGQFSRTDVEDPPAFSRPILNGYQVSRRGLCSMGSLVHGNILPQQMMIPFGKEDSWTGSSITYVRQEAEVFLTIAVWKISCWTDTLLTSVLGTGTRRRSPISRIQEYRKGSDLCL